MQTSQRRRLSRSSLCGAFALACGGFDPDFGPQPGSSSSGGLAGWSYDAGVEPEPGQAGRGGAIQSGSGGAAGRTPAQNKPNEAQGGEGGESDHAGAGEPAQHAGAGSFDAGGAASAAGSGGAGGTAAIGAGAQGGTAGALSTGGRTGAASGSGGAAGVANGGVSGGSGAGSSNASAGAGGSEVAGGSGGSGAGSGGEGNAGGTGGGAPPVYALIISEYVETSASFKAIELRALRTSSLDGCRVVTYFNTGRHSGTSITGKLDEGDVYLLCTSSLAEELGAACDQTASLPFNGDDAVVLECGGLPIDSLGQIGVDPGSAWESGDASTLDRTLRRRCSVTTGDAEPTDPFDPSVEWSSHPDNTFTGLGDPACD